MAKDPPPRGIHGEPASRYLLLSSGFAPVPRWTWRHPCFDDGLRLCYASLLRRADEHGCVRVPQQALADELGKDLSTIKRYLRQLETLALIRRDRIEGRGNVYVLLWHDEWMSRAEMTGVTAIHPTDQWCTHAPLQGAPTPHYEGIHYETLVNKGLAATPNPSNEGYGSAAGLSASLGTPDPEASDNHLIAELIAEVIGKLIAAGMSRQKAEILADLNPDECLRQLDYLPFRKGDNPGGLLAASIEGQWETPLGYLQAQEAAAAAAAEAQKQADAEARHRARVEAAAREEQAFEAWLTELPPAFRAEYDGRARAEVRRTQSTVADLGQRNPKSAVYLAAHREALKAIWREVSR